LTAKQLRSAAKFPGFRVPEKFAKFATFNTWFAWIAL
jgi:hypothetical protein